MAINAPTDDAAVRQLSNPVETAAFNCDMHSDCEFFGAVDGYIDDRSRKEPIIFGAFATTSSKETPCTQKGSVRPLALVLLVLPKSVLRINQFTFRVSPSGVYDGKAR